MDVFADLQIDPEARQECGEDHGEGVQRGDPQQIADIVIANRGGLRGGEVLGRDPEFPEIVGVQGAFHHDGGLCGGGELDNLVGGVGFGRGECEGAGEPFEVVRVLDDVMSKALG